MEIEFIKKILMSTSEYWIVAKKITVSNMGRSERIEDDIIFIAIPQGIKRGLKYEEITLQEMEKFQRVYIEQNIYINRDYAPFQTGQGFYNIYDGFPIKENQKEFLIKALELKSNELRDYKSLIVNQN